MCCNFGWRRLALSRPHATLDDAGTAGNTPHTVAVVEAQGVEPEPRDFLSL